MTKKRTIHLRTITLSMFVGCVVLLEIPNTSGEEKVDRDGYSSHAPVDGLPISQETDGGKGRGRVKLPSKDSANDKGVDKLDKGSTDNVEVRSSEPNPGDYGPPGGAKEHVY